MITIQSNESFFFSIQKHLACMCLLYILTKMDEKHIEKLLFNERLTSLSYEAFHYRSLNFIKKCVANMLSVFR